MIENDNNEAMIKIDSYVKERKSNTEINSDFNDGCGLINKEIIEMWYGNRSMTEQLRRYLFPTLGEMAEALNTTVEALKRLADAGEYNEDVSLTKKKIKQMIKSAERVGNYMEVKRLREMYSKCKL